MVFLFEFDVTYEIRQFSESTIFNVTLNRKLRKKCKIFFQFKTFELILIFTLQKNYIVKFIKNVSHLVKNFSNLILVIQFFYSFFIDLIYSTKKYTIFTIFNENVQRKKSWSLVRSEAFGRKPFIPSITPANNPQQSK